MRSTIILLAVFLPLILGIQICSPNFESGECLPNVYGSPVGAPGEACGTGVSPNPGIRWSLEEDALSYVLVLDDMTVGNYVHWAVKDIPQGVLEIERGTAGTGDLPGVDIGHTWDVTAYGAPCGGPENVYRFTIYAMSVASSALESPFVSGLDGEEIRTFLEGEGVVSFAEIMVPFLRGGECDDLPVECGFAAGTEDPENDTSIPDNSTSTVTTAPPSNSTSDPDDTPNPTNMTSSPSSTPELTEPPTASISPNETESPSKNETDINNQSDGQSIQPFHSMLVPFLCFISSLFLFKW